MEKCGCLFYFIKSISFFPYNFVELPEEEIEKMLEEDLPEDFKGVPKPKAKKYIKRQKIILEGTGTFLLRGIERASKGGYRSR